MLSREEALLKIRKLAVLDPNKKKLILDNPEIRYLSENQACEWIKISQSENVHSLGQEMVIVDRNIDEILPLLGDSITIVDLGCGDGRKSVQLINILIQHGINIHRYYAVDVNELFINKTIELVLGNTKLGKSVCFGINREFQYMANEEMPWNSKESRSNIVYVLLGNTYNNFSPKLIVEILGNIVQNKQALILGLKVRNGLKNLEILRILKQYKSYGDAFTFSLGELFGLDERRMKRRVKYNKEFNRIEIWLRIKDGIDIFGNGILAYDLLVCNSYKPTVFDVQELLRNVFSVCLNWSLENRDDVIFFCKK